MIRYTLLTAALFASSALAGDAPAGNSCVVNYDWTVANGKVAPDGVTRDAVLVNQRFPGPLITAKKGDTIQVNVKNMLTNTSMLTPTTIHWHGLFQHRNADDDGPAFVTQCPIVPNNTFTYTIPTGEQSGTYWYHSHLRGQYVDGLRGPIVVYDPEDPNKHLYDCDDEKTVMVLGDWYHLNAEAVLASGNIALEQPDSGTINGKGRFAPLNLPANPDTLYTLKVKKGKRYRLRVINASAIATFRFSVQGHKLTVIEEDGIATQPKTCIDAFDIMAGQRYSVILEANQKPDTYWVSAPMTNVANRTAEALIVYEDDERPYHPPSGAPAKMEISKAYADYWKHDHKNMKNMKRDTAAVSATLNYGKGNDKCPSTNGTNVLDELSLVPYLHPGACNPNKSADNTFNLFFDVLAGKWRINGISFKSPVEPTLVKILNDKNKVTTESEFDQSEHTVILPKNKCMEFNITGAPVPAISHPIHLHGHAFDVIQSAGSKVNFANPPRRDVHGVTPAGARFRFMTDNPGPWFLHCHIDWHLVEGFAMVFAEAPEDMKKGPQSVKTSKQWEELCPIYNTFIKNNPQSKPPVAI